MFTVLTVAAGAASWSLSEYLIHRYVGHGPKRKRAEGWGRFSLKGIAAEFNAEHLAHHSNPQYFSPSSRKAASALTVLGVVGSGLAVTLGAKTALAYTLGFGVTYTAYEVVHRRVHTHPPTGPYGRWVRRHHLLHHHKSPRENHGVTSALWDHVFGTFTTLPKVRVPRNSAPPWMTDPLTNQVRSEFAADYELVGKVQDA
ncbi:MAG: sterol desaturase family protein [Polyangiaceae bacterium]|nr:sterol desaturase family protein [Polyangiaceae bacterium]